MHTISPIGLILIVILVVLVIGAFPRWGYSSGWGYYPSSLIGVLLVIILILLIMGVL